MKKTNNKPINIISVVVLCAILVCFYFFSPTFRAALEKHGITDVFSHEEIIDGLQVHFIDVGQGDSILIKDDTFAVLIDAGPNSSEEKLLSYLKDEGIKKLDCLVLTHPHEDHIGGADLIIDSIKIDSLLMSDCTQSSAAFENLLDSVENNNLTITIPLSGDKFSLGKLDFTVLAPNSESYEETNNYSIVLKLDYGDTSFIFTGDAETLSEEEILKKFDESELKCDVLKAGHHGSFTSNSKDFVKTLSPEYAVVSCEIDNSYGHPHKEVLALFDENNIKVYRTDLDSSIVFVTDGNIISVK